MKQLSSLAFSPDGSELAVTVGHRVSLLMLSRCHAIFTRSLGFAAHDPEAPYVLWHNHWQHVLVLRNLEAPPVSSGTTFDKTSINFQRFKALVMLFLGVIPDLKFSLPWRPLSLVTHSMANCLQLYMKAPVVAACHILC